MSDTKSSATPAIIFAIVVPFLLLGGLGFILNLVKVAIIFSAVLVIIGGLAWNFLGRSSDD